MSWQEQNTGRMAGRGEVVTPKDIRGQMRLPNGAGHTDRTGERHIELSVGEYQRIAHIEMRDRHNDAMNGSDDVPHG